MLSLICHGLRNSHTETHFCVREQKALFGVYFLHKRNVRGSIRALDHHGRLSRVLVPTQYSCPTQRYQLIQPLNGVLCKFISLR